MEFNDNGFDPNEEINFDEPQEDTFDSSMDESTTYQDASLDDLDMGYVGNTEKTRKITMWTMIGTAAALIVAFCLIGGLYLSEKSNKKEIKEWVSEYLETNLADAGLSEAEMEDIAERVTPLFFDQFGDEIDLSALPEDQVAALVEQMKDPLKKYIAADASNLISEDMVKQYIDKEYGEVADMASRIKELETTSNSVERQITTLKETAAQGAQGEKGQKGDTGAQGAAGAQGAQGPQGSQGPQGAQGAKGEKGDTGAQGAKGEKGDTGAQGAAGKDGTGATVRTDSTTGITTITDGAGNVATVSNGTSTYIVYASKKDSPSKTDIRTTMDATHKYMGTFMTTKPLANEDEIMTEAAAKVTSWNETVAGNLTYDPTYNTLVISQ